jgi:hypothetical protein
MEVLSMSKRTKTDPATTETNDNGTANKPAHSIRYGKVRISIWARATDQGTFYSTKLSRSYRDGEEWKNTDYLDRDTLLVAAKLCSEAHSWICEQLQAAES